MPDKYYLVESGALEKLLRTHFMLTQSTLLFEHLLSHSDRPMFLSARKVCEVLELRRAACMVVQLHLVRTLRRL